MKLAKVNFPKDTFTVDDSEAVNPSFQRLTLRVRLTAVIEAGKVKRVPSTDKTVRANKETGKRFKAVKINNRK